MIYFCLILSYILAKLQKIQRGLQIFFTFLSCLNPLIVGLIRIFRTGLVKKLLKRKKKAVIKEGEENLDDKIEVKQQLIAYSNIISNFQDANLMETYYKARKIKTIQDLFDKLDIAEKDLNECRRIMNSSFNKIQDILSKDIFISEISNQPFDFNINNSLIVTPAIFE